MSEIPQLKPLLLSSAIWRRLSAKLDLDDALPINLSTNVIERLTKDPVRADHLSNLAIRIWDHLEARRPGWVPWPKNTEDALVVSMLLSFQIEYAVNQSILSPEERAVFERESIRQGLSREQLLINFIVERVEGQGEGDQWKGME